MHKRIILALAALAAGAAAAQDRARPDPAEPGTKVPPAQYRSAFEGYRPLGDDKLAPWRESNEAVKEAEGHGGRHGQKPPAQSKPQANPQAGGGHGEHK